MKIFSHRGGAEKDAEKFKSCFSPRLSPRLRASAVREQTPMNRRNFVQTAAGSALAAAAAPQAASKMIGIQVGAVSFVDEGVEKVLDIFQKEAAINTLFVATFTYGRGIAGRQVPGQPLPDHGKQEYDNGSGPGTFQGGAYTKYHSQY